MVHIYVKVYEVSRFNGFGDTVMDMPKSLGLMWPKQRSLSVVMYASLRNAQDEAEHQVCFVYSFTDFGDTVEDMPKLLGSRELGHAPFQKKYFNLVGRDKTKLFPKFEISSFTGFGDIVEAIPNFLRVT